MRPRSTTPRFISGSITLFNSCQYGSTRSSFGTGSWRVDFGTDFLFAGFDLVADFLIIFFGII